MPSFFLGVTGKVLLMIFYYTALRAFFEALTQRTDGGTKSSRGGSFSTFYLIVRKFSHVIFQMFPCHLCDRDYCWRSSLEKHLRAYHGEPQFSCPLCPRIFRHKASLEQHSFSKHNPGFQKFMCDLCGKNYLTKWGLTRHARIHSDLNNNSKSVL